LCLRSKIRTSSLFPIPEFSDNDPIFALFGQVAAGIP
jgi:hypothetical protein